MHQNAVDADGMTWRNVQVTHRYSRFQRAGFNADWQHFRMVGEGGRVAARADPFNSPEACVQG